MPDVETIRIAMWSGPRNISTAMMRAWENRADTAVVDEPFYACYLSNTGIRHPMHDEVLASQSTDWNTVIRQELQKDLQDGQTIQYQKHMTHHMVADISQDWFDSVQHAFLIRHPAEVLMSYIEKRESVTAADLGFARQKELYEAATKPDRAPPVIDARDVLQNPKATLNALCDSLNIDFDPDMLSWPAGIRDSDGVWAPHWYHNVARSTGFAPYQQRQIQLNQEEQAIVDECLPHYNYLSERRIKL